MWLGYVNFIKVVCTTSQNYFMDLVETREPNDRIVKVSLK